MNFETVTLGDLVKHKKGFAFKTKDYCETGIPVIKVSNFTNNSIEDIDLQYVPQAIANQNKSVELKENDIVIATVGSWASNPNSVVGKTIRVPSWANGSLMNQNAVILRSKNDSLVDQLFIFYYMKQQSFKDLIVSRSQGSANQASITLESIFSCPVILPNNKTREAIVQVLSNLDKKIEVLHKNNKTLQSINQALFKSWFVDFDPVYKNQKKLHANGITQSTMTLFSDNMKETEIGKVPADWEVQELKELATRYVGKVKNPEDWHNLPLIDLSRIKSKTLFNVNHGLGQELTTSVTKFNKGDILFGAIRPYFHKVTLADLDGVTNVSVFVVRPKDNRYYEYLLNLMFCESTVDYAVRLSKGTKMPVISWDDLSSLPLAVPPNAILSEFQKISGPLIQKGIENSNLINTLIETRDTLLPRLITGKIDLSEIEDQLEGVA